MAKAGTNRPLSQETSGTRPRAHRHPQRALCLHGQREVSRSRARRIARAIRSRAFLRAGQEGARACPHCLIGGGSAKKAAPGRPLRRFFSQRLMRRCCASHTLAAPQRLGARARARPRVPRRSRADPSPPSSSSPSSFLPPPSLAIPCRHLPAAARALLGRDACPATAMVGVAMTPSPSSPAPLAARATRRGSWRRNFRPPGWVTSLSAR